MKRCPTRKHSSRTRTNCSSDLYSGGRILYPWIPYSPIPYHQIPYLPAYSNPQDTLPLDTLLPDTHTSDILSQIPYSLLHTLPLHTLPLDTLPPRKDTGPEDTLPLRRHLVPGIPYSSVNRDTSEMITFPLRSVINFVLENVGEYTGFWCIAWNLNGVVRLFLKSRLFLKL